MNTGHLTEMERLSHPGIGGKISFPAQIDQKLFEVPPEAEIKIAESKAEYGSAYIDNFSAGEINTFSATTRVIANIGRGVGAFLRSIGFWILNNGGWFFCILGGLSLAAILVVKLTNKR